MSERLDAPGWQRRLENRGVILRAGPFVARFQSSLPDLGKDIHALYADYPVEHDVEFVDVELKLIKPLTRRLLRAKYTLQVDGETPFQAFPSDHILPMLEWVMNWAIVERSNEYLIIHAATIAKNGRAAILPGQPGAGKSTLTAALVHRGWRLLSDEFALISPQNGSIVPMVRPISLKNNSIDIIRGFVPGAYLSREAYETNKGTVALLRAPAESVAAIDEPAMPAWVIFPKFVRGAPTRLEPTSRALSLLDIGDNAFNYSDYGERGFEILARTIDACQCYNFSYSSLEEAVTVFADLRPD